MKGFKQCPACDAANGTRAKKCSECGEAFGGDAKSASKPVAPKSNLVELVEAITMADALLRQFEQSPEMDEIAGHLFRARSIAKGLG